MSTLLKIKTMQFQNNFLKISQNTLLVINSIFVSFISILLGFFFATTLSTILGQTGDWGILSSGILVALLEIVSKIVYDTKKKSFFIKKNNRKALKLLRLLNNVKIGFMYGLFVEAFKLGS
jgi:hypothetical protein